MSLNFGENDNDSTRSARMIMMYMLMTAYHNVFINQILMSDRSRLRDYFLSQNKY